MNGPQEPGKDDHSTYRRHAFKEPTGLLLAALLSAGTEDEEHDGAHESKHQQGYSHTGGSASMVPAAFEKLAMHHPFPFLNAGLPVSIMLNRNTG